MWTYRQSTGILTDKTGTRVGLGYSGKGDGKNNPQFQARHNVGPIPRGFYKIEAPHDSPAHGPYCLTLTPFPENEMFGRSAFLMHGDSKDHPGNASEGCVIQGPVVRKQVWASGDHLLEVIE